MATRLGLSLVLLIGLNLTQARAQAPAEGDEIRNQFGLCRQRIRNLAAAVRERLDEADSGAALADEQKRRLMDQKMAVSKAQVAVEQAKLDVAVAEVTVKEYELGTAKQQEVTIDGNIAMAQAELKRAEGRYEEDQKHAEETKALVERIDQMPKVSIGDFMSEYYAGQNRKQAENQVMADKFRIESAKLSCEQADVSKDVFLKYSRDRRLHELRAEVEKARSVFLAKQAESSLARDLEARLEREASRIDAHAPTPAEHAALDRFLALEKPWRAILARRDAIEKADPAKRAELKRSLDDLAKSLLEAEHAWSAAREAQLDDRDAATMARVRRGP